MSIRWFPVGPYTHEATYGPYVARMTHEERGWNQLAVFNGGVWQYGKWAAPKRLRQTFREIVERYELERDRARLRSIHENGLCREWLEECEEPSPTWERFIELVDEQVAMDDWERTQVGETEEDA